MSDCITAEDLLQTVVDLLATPVKVAGRNTYPTDAGARVMTWRDWPTLTGQYPSILASLPDERKEGLGRAQPQFTTTVGVRLLVRVDAVAAAGDGNSGTAQSQLWKIKRQIERTLIGAPALMSQIQQIASVHSQIAYNSKGEKHVFELGMEFELEIYESPWAFFDPLGTPLGEVVMATDAADFAPANPAGAHVAPGLDIILPT